MLATTYHSFYKTDQMTAYIIGIGLIGGSFALSLKEHNICSRVIGFDSSEENLKEALSRGIIDAEATMESGIEHSDLIVIATPVDSNPHIAVRALDLATNGQVVIDMGSTKHNICLEVANHARRGQFVATHPMWGTEYSGPKAAQSGAFTSRSVVICNKERSSHEALSLVEKIYTTIGMPIIYMSSEEHDIHAAYVSHISHITSFALALTVLEKEQSDKHIFDMAGGGFASTVRLAKSSADTWAPILIQNSNHILDVLDENIAQLELIRQALSNGDAEAIKQIIGRANKIEKIIK